MPGGIDPHVHLEAPMMGAVSIDDFYRHARSWPVHPSFVSEH